MTGIDTRDDARIRERLVALTRDLMLIPSIPSRPDELRRCHDSVKNHLEGISGVSVFEYDCDGELSMVARPESIGEPEVLLCAHLDVITHPDLELYRSRMEGGRIVGPGSGDMKGALAILLEVFGTVHQAMPGASLGIAITSDEETGGEKGMGYLFREAGVRCGIALIPDGGSLTEVTVEEKGILHLRAKAIGSAGHAARPWLSENPVEKLSDELGRLRNRFREFETTVDQWQPTASVTMFGTENRTVNRVPEEATAVLDIRFPAPYTAAKMLEIVREAISDQIDIEVIIQAEATRLKPDRRFLEITEKITGEPAREVRDHGGSDARFLAELGIPVIMSRPLVGNLHAGDEWIDIESMVTFYRIYEHFLAHRLNFEEKNRPRR